MHKECPEHGPHTVLISSDAAWYRTMIEEFPAHLRAPQHHKNVQQGCPFDCGSCSSHQQKTYLPVVPITSSCNLDCLICYTHNKNEGAYHTSLDEFDKILAHVKRNDPE